MYLNNTLGEPLVPLGTSFFIMTAELQLSLLSWQPVNHRTRLLDHTIVKPNVTWTGWVCSQSQYNLWWSSTLIEVITLCVESEMALWNCSFHYENTNLPFSPKSIKFWNCVGIRDVIETLFTSLIWGKERVISWVYHEPITKPCLDYNVTIFFF